jgi:hypothetical protein
MMLLLVSFILSFIIFQFMAEKHPRTFFTVIALLKLVLYLQAFGFLMKSPEKFSKLDSVLEYLNNPKINQSV